MAQIPERTCVICRTKKQKDELFRFISKNGQIFFDKLGLQAGRGFYICSKKCWEIAVAKKRKIKISSRLNNFIKLPNKDFEDILRD